MRKYIALALLLLLALSAPLQPGTAAASDNDTPLAEAGLDQTVDRGTTVHLDAAGSHDPDGRLTGTQWTIRRPDGTTTTPDCATCARTTFTPQRTGQYAFTVHVTDDDGATAEDTMYVTVTPGDPPGVVVRGPRVTETGEPATYTAAATAGTADLDALTWYVDGDRAGTTDLDDRSANDTLTYHFATPGTHAVRVTVTDADDQRDTATTRTRAVTPTVLDPTRPAPTATDPPNADSNPESTPAPDTHDPPAPELHGPRVLTGDRPLTGTYRVTNTDTATLFVDGRTRATTTNATLTLAPGIHDVFATTNATTFVRFPDNGTTVVADPTPVATIATLSTSNGLRVTAAATDAFDNLESIAITLDGRRVDRHTLSIRDYITDGGHTLQTTYRTNALTPGNHTITVTATDTRNQTDTATRTIYVREPPEIVDAYFVEPHDDDRMAYHERLDPANYTAHHVLEIDLNEYDPAEVEVDSSPAVTEVIQINERGYQTSSSYDSKNNVLTVHTYWAADIPKQGTVSHSLEWSNRTTTQPFRETDFYVGPSDPVIRYTIDHEGVTPYHPEWGILINASNSFDPDNTKIEFSWLKGAESTSYADSVGKADAFRTVELLIEDNNFGKSRESLGFLDHYVPTFANVSEVSEGPYRWDDVVEFRVESEVVTLTKESYEFDLEIGLEIDGAGEVVSWTKDRVLITEGRTRGKGVVFSGVVRVPAYALENASLVMANEQGSGWNEMETDLPAVPGVQRVAETVRSEEIVGVEYLVDRPVYETERTTSEWEKRDLMADGYLVTGVEQVGTRYVVEERQVASPAVYETERMRFRQQGYLEAFLSTNPEWSEGRAETRVRTYTTTEYEWRSSRTGSGTFTGETRRVLTDPAEYQTFKQYEYDRRVERTGTRTVTRYRIERIPIETTETVIKCNSFFGCYEATVTNTEWVEVRKPYTATETYTYTTIETERYWGFWKRGWSHEFTGATRQIKVDDAEYETQYRYRYEQTHREQETIYSATRQRLVEPTVYEWVPVSSVTSVLDAAGLATDPTRRIGSTTPIREWTLQKQRGTESTWVSSPPDPREAIQTRYEIRVTRTVTFVDENGTVTTTRVIENTTTRTYPGYRPIGTR